MEWDIWYKEDATGNLKQIIVQGDIHLVRRIWDTMKIVCYDIVSRRP